MLKVKEVISVLWVSGQVAVFVPVVVVSAVATMAWHPSPLLLGLCKEFIQQQSPPSHGDGTLNMFS